MEPMDAIEKRIARMRLPEAEATWLLEQIKLRNAKIRNLTAISELDRMALRDMANPALTAYQPQARSAVPIVSDNALGR